jgi:anti-sigma-K factor RskA
MEYSEDHIALAAEYAIGTLDADERAQVETMMSVDSEFTAIVRGWEYRLGVLNQMVGSVEPSPEVWERIKTAVGWTGQPREPLVSPEPPPMPPAAQISEAVASLESSMSAPPIAPEKMETLVREPRMPPPADLVESDTLVRVPPRAETADVDNIVALTRRTRSYRNIAVAMTAIAAALLALIGMQVVSPQLVPGLGGKPRTQVAEVRPAPTPTPTPQAPSPVPSAQYVALLQGSAGGPAFILTVDTATKNFTVRKLGAPPIDANRNYELWLISDKLQSRPRSLGVIGASEFTSRALLTGYDSEVINSATYAVTVEQSGGSPDGTPHSQPVFIGRLIETVPATPTPSPTRTR